MLVLTRKVNEVITIGHDVRITVVDVRGDKVRLGIEAPQGVPVHRKEVYDMVFPAVAEAACDEPQLPEQAK